MSQVVIYAVRGSPARYKVRKITTVPIGANVWTVIVPFAIGKRGSSEWHKLKAPKPMVVLDSHLIDSTVTSEPISMQDA
jgi:hypothetical protein